MPNNDNINAYLEKKIKDKEMLLELCNKDIDSGKLSEKELEEAKKFREYCEEKISDYKERLNRK